MSSKFSKEDINEIASKLEWKPNKLTYAIFYTVIALSILSLLVVIYLIILHKDLKHKFKIINNTFEFFEERNSSFTNMINDTKENLLDNSNELRYLTRRSERNVDNSSLSEKSNAEMPIFANEIENNKLFSALNGV